MREGSGGGSSASRSRGGASASPGSPAGSSGLRPYFFDLLHLDGTDLLDEPGRVRWAALADAVPPASIVGREVAETGEQAAAAFAAALAASQEGVVIKSPDAPYDVVFSNAALQWLPDHAAVLRRWFAAVAPGGTLAVQLPVAHLRSPLHRLVHDVAAMPEWAALTAGCDGAVCHEPGFYYDVLCESAARIDVWETEYAHVLADAAAIVTWLLDASFRNYRMPRGWGSRRQASPCWWTPKGPRLPGRDPAGGRR